MKNLVLIPFFFILFFHQKALSNGVCIVDAGAGTFLQLISSDIDVIVNDQIATVTLTAQFRNNTDNDTKLKFGFPMTETASAISLNWFNNGAWYEADFAPEAQDTTLPGGGGNAPFIDPDLKNYLGENPLYFDLEQYVPVDSVIIFKLVYVDLLPYAFNKVEFWFPNRYDLIQSEAIADQSFRFSLFSQRSIELVELSSHSGASVQNSGNSALVEYSAQNTIPSTDYLLEYTLNADELGIFPFSTYLVDSSMVCDDFGQGFFAFIVEPDPSENTSVIDKAFTLIIDKSGSMSGDKMQQAKDAAKFIVNNLNIGDKFNLVVFDNNIISFKPDHVDYNLNTKGEALNFINQLNAGGSTNISGAFSEAIPDFAGNSNEIANIIIFFTDGQATSGITTTEGILDHVQGLISSYDIQGLSIFTFGVGSSVNKQLLTLLANSNLGLSFFLENSDLQASISEFYLTIQNPVLLYPQMTFTPDIIKETHPVQLPNLFKGQQLIVVGRYEEPTDVNIHFSGTAFGQPVAYDYLVPLADTSVNGLQFLPRLWAKQRMADLYQQFFTYPAGSPEAKTLEETIIETSICYGVISPFTSFEDNSGGGGYYPTEVDERLNEIDGLEIHVLPNPFRQKVIFQISTIIAYHETAFIEIFDINGRIVKRLRVEIKGTGEYMVEWNGSDAIGGTVPSGIYTYRLMMKGGIAAGQIIKM